ncbi:MAG: hypothetical protein M0R48_05705 [Candidatus Omnitrophica bacterium]|jgi:DNA-binding transcriptional MerR regulator|nr:hypothetical protein [Candidatus Omnitrophota bacterium]
MKWSISSNQPKLCSATKILKELGGKLSKKMFEYLRDTFRLIPPPIKRSEGKGIIALYPESVVFYLRRILIKQSKGFTFKQIKEKLKIDTERIFQETDALKRQFELEKEFKRRLVRGLKTGDHPAFDDGNVIGSANKQSEDIESMIEIVKKEFKRQASKLDDVSIKAIRTLRKKLDELEKLEGEKKFSQYVIEEITKVANEKTRD